MSLVRSQESVNLARATAHGSRYVLDAAYGLIAWLDIDFTEAGNSDEDLIAVLESVEELLSNRITGLTDLTVHINTAYTMSGNLSVIPEPFADIIKQNLKTQGLLLNIHFVNKKLSSFNPKDFYV